ncbi:MAG TPA: lasso peptide biosynthesis B2 protein [Armatimonadota bacterium]|nr:lasso peptide biosynthesis B2 protein [Armatimonadota bacterium]
MTLWGRFGSRLEAAALLLVAGPAYRLLPTNTFLRWWTPPPRRRCGMRVVDVDGLARAVDDVLAVSRRRNCLTRSLMLYRMLRRRGVEVELRIGVRREGAEGIAGHAWLLLDGSPCCPYGPDPSGYVVTLDYPNEGPDH